MRILTRAQPWAMILVPAVLFALSVRPIYAQQPDSSVELADQPAATAAAAPETELSEVQVTGTRIIRQGYEAPTPVTVVGIQQLQDQPSMEIADTLNEMPVFQGSNKANSTGSTNTGTGSENYLNLRNLGINRTLVLVDGRRMPPDTIANWAVDVDMIPDALIQRVDIVTGGASAVYGSDAVAGVVNFVLDTNFTGIKAQLEGGESVHGDGATDKIELTAGTTFFDGRVHVLLSGDQAYENEIPGTARAWNMTGWQAIVNPGYTKTNGQPQYLELPSVGDSDGNPGGIITAGALKGTAFGTGGSVFQWNYGSLQSGENQVGGDWLMGSQYGAESLQPSINQTHFFSRVAVDITPNVQVYAEAMIGNIHTVAQCCYTYYLGNLTVNANNPYLPASVQTAAAADHLTTLPFGTILSAAGTPMGFGDVNAHYNDVYVAGANGKFAALKSTWNWQVYAQNGVSIQDIYVPYQVNVANFKNALDAVTVTPTNVGSSGLPIGSIACASTLTSPKNGCVPYNAFGTGVTTQSMLAYSFAGGGPRLRQDLTENIVGGSITGEPFATWAGPVSIAADAEYRRDSVDGNSDALSRQTGWFSTQLRAFDANDHVEEGALETVIPLIKDITAVKELDANGAARATEYSVSGYVTTWKYGLEYTPITDVRFRATRSADIRAPNLNDLFSGASETHNTIADPFNGNQLFPFYEITQGNRNLKPEKAHTTGIGIVFQPVEVPGLQLSADYFHIKLDDAISLLSYPFILDQCYATQIPGTFTGTSPFCSLITRFPNGTINTETQQGINLASILVEGVDYSLDYTKRLTDLVSSWEGTVSFRLNATNTIHVTTNSGIPGPAEITDSAGYGNSPRWSALASLDYQLERFRINWTEQYYSAVLNSDAWIQCGANCPTPVPTGFQTINNMRFPSYFLASLSATYRFLDQSPTTGEAFVSVNNVFNRDPPLDSLATTTYGIRTNPVLYDTIGLFMRVGVRFRL